MIYQAEMSLEAQERGPEVSYQLALLITGVALAYWVDLGFVQGLDKHPWLWRIPLAMQSCFAIFAASLLLLLPDTPRWYYARGRDEEGDQVLARLHALPVDHEAVQLVKSEIKASLDEEDDTGKISLTILFWDNTELQFGRRLRTSFLINWVCCFQQNGFSSLTRAKMIVPGATILRNQHARLFFHHDIFESELLAAVVWRPCRCTQHSLCHRIVSPHLLY